MAATTTTGPTPILSVNAFLIFLWISAALMTICFVARAYIRVVCFGRLLLEDWLVAAALAIFICMAAVWQKYLKYMYEMAFDVEGTFVPGPNFVDDIKFALRACGSMSITVYIGLWLIKASFLVLFYRLGHQIRMYYQAWWACTALVIICGAVGLGLNQYGCMFAPIDNIFAECMTPGSLHDIFVKEIVASAMDVLSDLLIIIFPIWILWRTRVSLRQKVVFSAVFCLVGLTVSITVVRGSFSKIIVQQPEYALNQINITWPFWFTVEYLTSFLVACSISFRSLFVQRRAKIRAANEAVVQRNRPSTSVKKNRIRRYLDGLSDKLVSTARHLEGAGYEHATWKLPMPTSGLMTVDFSREDGWRRMGEEDGESLRPLEPVVRKEAQSQTIVGTAV